MLAVVTTVKEEDLCILTSPVPFKPMSHLSDGNVAIGNRRVSVSVRNTPALNRSAYGQKRPF